MTDAIRSPFVGGSAVDLAFEEGDRGDVVDAGGVVDIPAAVVPAIDDDNDELNSDGIIPTETTPVVPEEDQGNVVVEPVVPAEAPVVEPAAPAVEAAVVETTDEPPVTGGKKEFLARLATKNRKIAEREARIVALEAQLSGQAAPAPAAAPAAPARPASVAAPDFTARRQEVANLIIDGKTAEAAALQTSIDNDLIDYATTRALSKFNEQRTAETVDAVVSDLVGTHDFLDQDSDNFEPRIVRMLNGAAEEYMAEGHDHATALRMAADYVIPMVRPAAVVAPVATAPVAKPAAVKPAAVAKNVSAAAAQAPATPAGTSTRTAAATASTKDIFEMTQAEFDALTPAQIAQLRGDAV